MLQTICVSCIIGQFYFGRATKNLHTYYAASYHCRTPVIQSKVTTRTAIIKGSVDTIWSSHQQISHIKCFSVDFFLSASLQGLCYLCIVRLGPLLHTPGMRDASCNLHRRNDKEATKHPVPCWSWVTSCVFLPCEQRISPPMRLAISKCQVLQLVRITSSSKGKTVQPPKKVQRQVIIMYFRALTFGFAKPTITTLRYLANTIDKMNNYPDTML